jgi:rare lipoprotein A
VVVVEFEGLGLDIMKAIFLCTGLLLFFANISLPQSSVSAASGLASWYGEEHRGRLMANGKPFIPERFTAASWFYPLGTKVRVTTRAAAGTCRSVLVSVTDRGPALDLVRDGRIIDLSHGAFSKLAAPGSGLLAVSVQPVK